MSVDTSDVKELRDRTNAGILDCKEALQESGGDMDDAVEYLQKKGLSDAQQKSGRLAAEGRVEKWVSDDRTLGLLLEVNCETDFVARNDDFKAFSTELVELAGSSGASSVEELEDQSIDGTPVPDYTNEKISTIGENIELRRLEVLENPEGIIGAYIHAGSQIGVLTSVTSTGETDDEAVEDFARDVAMHVAAMDPPFLDADDIPEDALENQRSVFAAQMEDKGKPDDIIPQIVDGKIEKWKNENCLVHQPFVKDNDQTVGELQETLDGVELEDFIRFEVGEGIEEEDDEDFAEEVARELEDT
ncbi:MAG: translation elongation factor Ts [Bradymonadaceae bacterium]